MVKILSVSPAENKLITMNIIYGIHPTMLGCCLIGVKIPENAICYLQFVNNKSEINIKDLKCQWINARFRKDHFRTKRIIDQIMKKINNNKNNNNNNEDVEEEEEEEEEKEDDDDNSDICVYLVGTEFQLKVWEELMNIPVGETVTYHYIAKAIDCPRDIIKISKAIQSNYIGYIIPCYRTTSKGSRTITSCWKNNSLYTLLDFESQF